MEESTKTKDNVVSMDAMTKCEHCGGPKQRVRALTNALSIAEEKLAQAELTTKKVIESCEQHIERVQVEAFSERNCLLSALSRVHPSGLGIDGNMEKENPLWKHLLIIEFPNGQCAWNIHESDMRNGLFKHLGPWTKPFNGAMNQREKYGIVLSPQRKPKLILPGQF